MMAKARRSPWLDDRTTLLVTLLAQRHNLTVTEDVARQDISDHLDHVAAMMRIGPQAAKMYVTDQVITDMADRIAAAVTAHQGVVDLDTERRRRR
jgi:Zn-dependent protease with chaperone function